MSSNSSAREALTRAVNRAIANGAPVITEHRRIPTSEEIKADGNYRLAGQLSRLEGGDRYYGCHFGMRSTRDQAVREYFAGYDEIEAALCGHQ